MSEAPQWWTLPRTKKSSSEMQGPGQLCLPIGSLDMPHQTANCLSQSASSQRSQMSVSSERAPCEAYQSYSLDAGYELSLDKRRSWCDRLWTYSQICCPQSSYLYSQLSAFDCYWKQSHGIAHCFRSSVFACLSLALSLCADSLSPACWLSLTFCYSFDSYK